MTNETLLLWLKKMGILVSLSVLWLVSAVLIVTLVPGTVALYDSVSHCLWGEEKGAFRRFFRTLWKEMGRGILIFLLWGALAAVLALGLRVLVIQAQTSMPVAVFALIYALTLLFPMGVFSWLLPLESRFVYSFGELHKTAVLYVMHYLPATLLQVGALLLMVTLCVNFPVLLILAPGVLTLFQCAVIEKIFAEYMN